MESIDLFGEGKTGPYGQGRELQGPTVPARGPRETCFHLLDREPWSQRKSLSLDPTATSWLHGGRGLFS